MWIEIKIVYAVNLIVCRCIAVRTTLSDEALESAGPTFIRDDIGSVSLDDILNGDSVGYSM